MITEEGLTIDLDKLSLYDGIQPVNHFGKNPYTDKVITPKRRDKLTAVLSEKGMKLNRNVDFVLVSEFDAVIKYLEKGSGQVPDLLKESKPISNKEISDLTEDAQLLTEYRNIRQKMLDLGITVENMDEYLYKLRSMESEYKILNAEYAEISNFYRNISRLETNIDFANNPKFARGPFFDREKEIEPEVTVTSKDINGEDKKITDEIEKDASLTPDMWDERR